METNQNSHILPLVEDKSILRQTLQDTLKSDGYIVKAEASLEEIVGKVKDFFAKNS